VLQVGARKLTVKELRELLEKERPDPAESLPRPPLPERISELYGRLQRGALLVAKLETEGFDEAPEHEAALSERVRRQGLQLVVGRRIEERIRKKVDAAADALKRFYRENRFLYQSPLGSRSDASAGGPISARRRSGDLREALERADRPRDGGAADRGPRRCGGWLEPAAPAAMEPKVRLLRPNGPATGALSANRRRPDPCREARRAPRVAYDGWDRAAGLERRQQELHRGRLQLLRAEPSGSTRMLSNAPLAPATQIAAPASPRDHRHASWRSSAASCCPESRPCVQDG
jgi:hypothetical protein